MLPSRRFWIVASLAALAACTCGKKAATRKPLALEPLPEPPKVAIEPLPSQAGELTVVAARPQGQAAGNFHPSITFSRPVMALEAVSDERGQPPPARVEPPIAGTWHWLGSASVELVPSAPVPLSTHFKVTVPAGLAALDGSRLAKDYVFEFETPRAALLSVVPEQNFRWLKPSATFRMVFNQPVKDLARKAFLDLGPGKERVGLQIAKEEAPANAGKPVDFVSREARYTLKPEKALPLDAALILVVDAGLTGEGELSTEAPIRIGFRTYGPMRIDRASACVFGDDAGRCPYGPLALFTSNAPTLASVKGKVTVTPDPQIDWDRVEVYPGDERIDPYVSLPGRYRPGVEYHVQVAAGLGDEFGQTAGAFTGVARTDDLEPALDAGPDIALLEAGGDGALPLQVTNLNRVDADIYPVDAAAMARLLHKIAVPGKPVHVSLDVSGHPNAVRTVPLDLRGPLGRKTGLFMARLRSPTLPRNYESTVLGQITDLAVHAKLGATSGIAWVTSLASGKAVAGAAVHLLDAGGNSLFTGTTDGDGLVQLPGLATALPDAREYEWETPFAVVSAEKDGDLGLTLSTWQGGISPGSFDLRTEWDGKKARSTGMVFTERGIYRPGDEVDIKGIVRYRQLGELKSPAGEKLSVQVTTSHGNAMWKGDVTVTPFGTFSARVQVPAEAPLGTYELAATGQLKDAELSYSGSFRVEEYRAPQFQVDVSAASSSAVAGDTLDASVLSRYLFGGAMSGARVHWTVARTSTAFAPEGSGGFTFGPGTWSWNDEEPEPTSDTASGGDGLTDASGALALHAGKADAPGRRTYAYTIEAEVEDVSRQRVAGRTTITVHPAAVYAGLRQSGTGFTEAGKPLAVELVAVAPDGSRKSAVPISVELRRRDWKSIRKKGPGGQWFTESQSEEKRVGGCEVKSGTSPVACQMTPPEPGMYVIAATVTDSAGRKQTTTDSAYVVGSGWVSWQRNDTDRIDLVPDKNLYQAGETARVLVKSPYPEAEAVVTVEREGVRSARRIHLSGSATTVDVPLDESAIPDVFVSVLLVRGRVEESHGLESGDDPGRPAVRVGYAELSVEKKEKRLSVEVKPDAVEKRPRQKVAVDLAVKDFAGKPARAELAVWAVDEAVLRLTGYEVPDPVEAIHPERGLSVRIGEPLIHLVMRKLYGEKGANVGGGGGEGGGGFRNSFKTTVLFMPEVVTDASGRAHVEFELPDNLTTYRIMAVAVGETDRFGSGAAKVTVSKPLLALAALPRLLRVGDRASAGVVVHGRGFSAAKVKVTAQVEGVRLEGPSEKTVSVADGKPVEVRFGLVAEKQGTATLRFTVEGGGERDGLEQKLPVLLPVALEAVATYGDTDDRRVEGLVPPGNVRPDTGGLELTLASTVLGGFDEGMRQLVDYPYGCVEQLSSRLVPFVALRELYGKFGVAYDGAPPPDARERFMRELLGNDTLAAAGSTDPDAIVKATVRKIEDDQLPSGGFGYWPGDECESYDGSSYAVLSLSRAHEVGYAVDGAALDRGKRYLADVVASGQGSPCDWWNHRVSTEERVFALYVLARSGSPRPSYYGELYADRAQLPLYAQAMLADALFVGKGDRTQAQKLLTEVMNHAVETPAGVHFEESSSRTYAPAWSSDTRTTGIVLETLTDLSPDHPYVSKIGRYLTDVRKGTGRFRTTQEAAFSLMALTEVTRTKEAAPTDFSAHVLLGDKSVAEAKFAGKSMNIKTVSVPIGALGSQKAPLTFAREGSGVLYYGALLRYAPAEMPLTPLDQGIAVQRWFEPYAGGGQARSFYAGDLVRVKVRVATSQERSYVAIDVPLPSGLEAVDTSLSTTAARPGGRSAGVETGDDYANADDISEGEGEDEGQVPRWMRGFWSPFVHAENRDDRVVLFADHLPPGIHTATVVARATTPGDFMLKPAQAGEMYRPEVFGRSDGGRFSVIDASVVAER